MSTKDKIDTTNNLSTVEEIKEDKKCEDKSIIVQLQEELLQEKVKADDYFKRLQYLQADFENYRKRTDKELSEIRWLGNQTIIKDLLNTLDELEIAIKIGREAENKENIIIGLEMIYKKFFLILEQHGLSRIEAVGNKFDPNKHEVVSKVSSDKYDENTIVEEHRKGYIFKGKVVRPTMVTIVGTSTISSKQEEK